MVGKSKFVESNGKVTNWKFLYIIVHFFFFSIILFGKEKKKNA